MARGARAAADGALQNAQMRILSAAIAHMQAERYDEAMKTLEAERGIALKTPVGLNIVGDIHLKAERPKDALKAFDKALRLVPGFPEAHANRAVALQEMGRLEEALRAVDKAIRQRPNFPTAHFNRGNILRDMYRLEEAEAAFDKAIEQRKDFDEALVNRGTNRLDMGRGLPAINDFRAVLSRTPTDVNALVGRARAHRVLGEEGEAAGVIARALELAPDDVKVRIEKCRMLQHAKKYDPAVTLAEEIAEDFPDSYEALRLYAECLLSVEHLDEALDAADRAIALDPQVPMGHLTRALVLGQMGRYDEQAQALRRAESLGGRGSQLLQVQAMVLSENHQQEAALEAAREAAAANPYSEGIHTNLAMQLLKLGKLREGWEEYEWRLEGHEHPAREHLQRGPKWKGEPLEGKQLLVYHEQGHGDTLQFFRFLPMLTGRGAHITFLAPKPLLDVLRPAAPDITMIGELVTKRKFDYQISLMSLPQVLGITLDNLPADTPYVRPDPAYVEKWRDRLGDGFKVGLIWQGNPKYGADRFRSIPLKHYRPLADIPGIRLISLQVFHGLDQLDQLPGGMVVERLGEEITNNPSGYREVSGAMANLDLIVTSDTGPAHLAGNMGLPVWVAVRDNPDWRWLVEGDTSPWYPTMRVYRQETRDVWPPVFERIADDLRALLAER